MFQFYLWLYFGSLCTRTVFGQLSTTSQNEFSPDHCLLPQPPASGSFFSVFCYGEDNPWTECLNLPDTPVRPNWTLTYICDQGFYFPKGQGFVDIRCQGGQWVPPPPHCSDRICSPPADPPNGRYTPHPLDCAGDCAPLEDHLRDNSLLSLQCVGGYLPPLDNSALCIGGSWAEPEGCQRLPKRKEDSNYNHDLINSNSQHCQLPEPPEHGTYTSLACYGGGGDSHSSECDHLPGSPARASWTITFLCDDGFLPSNNQTYYHSKCVDGHWQPPPPTCQVNQMFAIPDRLQSSWLGDRTSVSLPLSLENGCTVPAHPAHGEYTISCMDTNCSASTGSVVPRGRKLTLSCHEGYRLAEQYALSTCDDGKWSPPPPTCADNSEELLEERDISEIQSKFAPCVLPEPPEHGSYALLSSRCHGAQMTQQHCHKSPGQTVRHLQVISIYCDRDYQLSGQTDASVLSSCDDGQWSNAFPQCFKPCLPLKSQTVDVECYQGPQPVPCDSPMVPGSSAVTKCKLNHATIDDPRDLLCKADGHWSGRLPVCRPNCGLSKIHTGKITPTILGGKESKLGYFPWHAGLYYRGDNKWEARCGGTLISPHIVLTAAHCVTQAATKMKPEDLRVALGKHYRDWDHKSEGVKREVKDIQILPNYLGQETLLDLDIALIALDSPVTVNSFVMPACVDYYRTHPLKPDMTGYLAGWGKTVECSVRQVCGDGSETLLYTNTSFLTFRQCRDAMQRIKKMSITRLTSDKFCAGNGSNSVAQKGDSGGGITFEFEDVHYVKGVISAKIVGYEDSYSFSAFTNVTHHITWIKKMASYFDSLAR